MRWITGIALLLAIGCFALNMLEGERGTRQLGQRPRFGSESSTTGRVDIANIEPGSTNARFRNVAPAESIDNVTEFRPLPKVPRASEPVIHSPEIAGSSISNEILSRVANTNSEIIQVHFSAPDTTSRGEKPAMAALPAVGLAPSVIQLAAGHINYGKALARKGATHSARIEFINALAAIAQSYDTQTGGREYTAALSRALKALDEADDFFVTNGGTNLDTDVSAIVGAHLSRVVVGEQRQRMTRAEALQAYYEYSRSELAAACGPNNWLASEAFYSLGRLHGLLGQAHVASQPIEFAKSVVFHFAALDCFPTNFASANELGVLLANSGKLVDARELLIRSVTIRPRAETWHNLATVHDRLGERELSQLARKEAELLQDSIPSENEEFRPIRWVGLPDFEAVPEFGNEQPTGSVANGGNDAYPEKMIR